MFSLYKIFSYLFLATLFEIQTKIHAVVATDLTTEQTKLVNRVIRNIHLLLVPLPDDAIRRHYITILRKFCENVKLDDVQENLLMNYVLDPLIEFYKEEEDGGSPLVDKEPKFLDIITKENLGDPEQNAKLVEFGSKALSIQNVLRNYLRNVRKICHKYADVYLNTGTNPLSVIKEAITKEEKIAVELENE